MTPGSAARTLLLLACLVPAAAFAGGNLTGSIHDGQGEPVVGILVRVSSPRLAAGPRELRSDHHGFGFFGLPAGRYRVYVDHPDFIGREHREVEVQEGSTTTLRLELEAADVYDEIVVTSATRRLDLRETSLTGYLDRANLTRQTVGAESRSIAGRVERSAGVVREGLNLRILGSTIGETRFLVDGIDTTDSATGTFGAPLLFDAIADLRVDLAGFEAETGWGTGGVINLVTRGGGERFAASADLRFSPSAWHENGRGADREEYPAESAQAQATASGPLLPGRAWFFAGAGWARSETTPEGSMVATRATSQPWFGKLSWQIAPRWHLDLSGFDGPTRVEHADAGPLVPPEAGRHQRQGGPSLHLDLQALLSPSWLASLDAGRVRKELDSFPESRDFETPGRQVVFGLGPDVGRRADNYDRAQLSKRDRNQLRVASSLELQAAGRHELTAGFDAVDVAFSFDPFTVSGFRFEDAAIESGGSVPFLLWAEPRLGPRRFEGDVRGGYLQSSWSPRPWWTVDLGVRFDRARSYDDLGRLVTAFDAWQPRLGLVWDLGRDGRTLFRAGWSQSLHPTTLNLALQAQAIRPPVAGYLSCRTVLGFSGPLCRSFFEGPVTTPGLELPGWIADPSGSDPDGFYLSPVNVFAFDSGRIDPELEGPRAETLVLRLERELAPRTSLELAWVDKQTERIVENTCGGNFPEPTEGADCRFLVNANLPGLERHWQGAILTLRSRFLELIDVTAAYTWSKSRGNVESPQGTGPEYDFFPQHYGLSRGFLGDDARHRVDLSGFTRLPAGFELALYYRWRTGLAYSVTDPAFPAGVSFVEPRGNQRTGSLDQLDLEVRRRFSWAGIDLSAFLAVHNALGGSASTRVCENRLGCGAVALGEGLDFQSPRRWEIGIRISTPSSAAP